MCMFYGTLGDCQTYDLDLEKSPKGNVNGMVYHESHQRIIFAVKNQVTSLAYYPIFFD